MRAAAPGKALMAFLCSGIPPDGYITTMRMRLYASGPVFAKGTATSVMKASLFGVSR